MNKINTFQTTTRTIMGPGAIKNIVAEAKRLGGTKAMIITDPGLVKTGIVNELESLLNKGNIGFSRFDSVEADPSYETAITAAEQVKKDGADIIIGIGGGSAQDIAKVSSILVTNKGPISEYFGIDLVPNPGMKLILIPTTAGTGSEVTPIAILSDHKEKLKKGIVSMHLFPSTALLDPLLTVGLPPHVTAATGMDALIHAIEAFTSKNATDMTDMLAIQAIKLINKNIRTAYANGENLEAREGMLEGSMLAGMAFANAGVTAVHAFAYPIGAEFHIPHGVANSIMLVPVMEFNMLGNLEKFARLAEILGEKTQGLSLRDSALRAVETLRTLTIDLNVPNKLSSFGVKASDIPELAKGVMKVTRLLANNPRVLRVEDAEAIYKRVL
ncbi:iron-containing alcohol dehydrogenase [Desulfovibrio litoralis]|uniref:Iron-containing alcohol dehydrogenase n=1 Tax=Desulfovibrio litoralis DSM 11393 TaxID=1121455 RepID=A0A1M7RYF6_9BACT|nr:iron-containing alcohol dehydrogenase [Desulfovibrio litoralis]SHN51369.1 Iron-containing alcohol dehydrogenase [Desulfovibrio litoralis DSM 11393]